MYLCHIYAGSNGNKYFKEISLNKVRDLCQVWELIRYRNYIITFVKACKELIDLICFSGISCIQVWNEKYVVKLQLHMPTVTINYRPAN